MEFLAFCGDGNVASGRTAVKVIEKGVRGRLVRLITSLVLISHSKMFLTSIFRVRFEPVNEDETHRLSRRREVNG